MIRFRLASVMLAAASITLVACNEQASLPEQAGYGPDPQLPPPNPGWIPTVNISTGTGWPQGAMPQAGRDLKVNAFAQDLQHPRWLLPLPNGDVLVAESDAPPQQEGTGGIRGWVQSYLMQEAGSKTPSADRITLLRDADGDGVAELRTPFIAKVTSPFGMTLVGNELYVAATDAVLRYPYEPGATSITAAPQKVVDLPAGPRNHHWTKNVQASPDGTKLYVTTGSNSNVAENGMPAEEGRAAIWEVDPRTGSYRIFATGLRNPNGLGFEPTTGALWTTVNERDEIGSDLVPDYMTSVKDGGFYGWPYSYYGQNVDERVEPPQPDLVARAIKPDYALGAHTASLGLAFADGRSLPEAYRQGVFIGQHGSWNRRPAAGFRVIFVAFENGMPRGMPVEVLGGFRDGEGNAMGRPVGVALDGKGGLLVADDVGNKIWRVTAANANQAAAP